MSEEESYSDSPLLIDKDDIEKMFSLDKPVKPAIVPDDLKEELEKSKSKTTKRISVFTKNMQTKLPRLLFLPGRTETINLDMVNEERYVKVIDEFYEDAKSSRIVSMMIYVDLQSSVSEISPCTIVSFSTPNLSVAMNVRPTISKGKSVVFPAKILEILEDSDIKVIIPGKTDWFYDNSNDFYERLKNDSSKLTICNTIQIVDYYKYLNIIETGKNVCGHMKLIHWIFQINFEYHLNGKNVSTPLSMSWKNMIHKYGSLLIYAYMALEQKREMYLNDMSKGVDRNPIYLEHLLIANGIVNDMTEDVLREKLIGRYSYPDPPLPDTPVSTK